MQSARSERMHPAHRRVFELLPWFQNGTLDEDGCGAVRAHLRECLVCTRELQRLERLAAAVAVPAEEHACAQAFGRLSARIAAGEREPPGVTARLTALLKGWREPIPLIAGAALLVLCATVAGLLAGGASHQGAARDQPFQTLGRKDGNQASTLSHPLLRVVLRGAPGERELHAWLARHGAVVVDGPSSIGVLTVRVALRNGSMAKMLAGMRADDETLFVEPVELIGSRPDRLR